MLRDAILVWSFGVSEVVIGKLRSVRPACKSRLHSKESPSLQTASQPLCVAIVAQGGQVTDHGGSVLGLWLVGPACKMSY